MYTTTLNFNICVILLTNKQNPMKTADKNITPLAEHGNKLTSCDMNKKN